MIDFLIVGTFKSASSTLAHELGQHPEIEIPKPKDPYYYLRGLAESYTGNPDFLAAHYASSVTDFAGFKALFGARTGCASISTNIRYTVHLDTIILQGALAWH